MKDPFPYLTANSTVDVLAQNDIDDVNSKDSKIACGGFILLKARESVVALWTEVEMRNRFSIEGAIRSAENKPLSEQGLVK
jgi:hypothetical protein